MPVVITHPEMGVYLGSCLGLGFWTLLDPVGQPLAATFADVDGATTHVASWDDNNDPAAYAFVEVDAGLFASVTALEAAGLGHLLGDMEDDALLMCQPAGHA